MRVLHPRWLLVLTLVLGGCLWPTDEDIDNELKRQLESVSGTWVATSSALTLNFQLTEGTGTAVSGSGTMKEAAAPASIPITVTGTFQRPQLSLTFSGMNFEGHAVQGTVQGSYTTAAGISAPLHLTGTGYTHDVTILLQEQ